MVCVSIKYSLQKHFPKLFVLLWLGYSNQLSQSQQSFAMASFRKLKKCKALECSIRCYIIIWVYEIYQSCIVIVILVLSKYYTTTNRKTLGKQIHYRTPYVCLYITKYIYVLIHITNFSK